MLQMLQIKAAIQKSFQNIGKKNGSAPPESDKNTFSQAFELFVSKELKSMAEKRYDAAKKAAVEAGIIDESKCVEGMEINTWQSEHFDVALKQSSSSQTLDKTMLKNNLMRELNMNETQVNDLIERSSKPRKGAVNINISLKG
jgi:hypothetical protein